MVRMPSVGGGGDKWSMGEKDVAHSFSESGVTLTHSKTRVKSGHVRLGYISEVMDDWEDNVVGTVKHADWGDWDTSNAASGTLSTVSSGALRGSYSLDITNVSNSTTSSEFSPSINTTHASETNRPWECYFDLVSSGDDYFWVELEDTVNNNQIGRVTFYFGGTVRLNGTDSGYNTPTQVTHCKLVPDWDAYEISLYLDGSHIITEAMGGSSSTGYDNAELGVRSYNGSSATVYWDDVAEYSGDETSGSVYVEWPTPTDIYAWDRASFTRTLDSESVDVYVEESSDGGSTWTEIAGPIERGDKIPADPSNEARFRVDFSRASTANNPTLDSIARRWVI